MNRITTLAFAACLSMTAMPLYADDAHHPGEAQQAADAKAAAGQPAAGQQVKRARETMQKLQDQMGQIRQTSDPGERRKLMHEHMQTMQEGMKQMRGMKMMCMAQGGKQGGMMMGGDMMKMHDMQGMMETRMEMMETMIGQMLQREEMRDAMPAK